MLKPAPRGARAIGATTLNEYQKYIEGRRPRTAIPAGVRRRAHGRGHDRDPPGPQERHEVHRRASPTRRSSPPRPSAPLHHRPVPSRQGDRLIDEAASGLRIEIDSPTEIVIERRIVQLEIEKRARPERPRRARGLKAIENPSEEKEKLAVKTARREEGDRRDRRLKGDLDPHRAEDAERAAISRRPPPRYGKPRTRRAEGGQAHASGRRRCSRKRSTRRTSPGRREVDGIPCRG